MSQPSRKTNQSRASVAIKQKETSNGKGGIIFLIILGILFGPGYISMKKEEAEWDMAQKQYRIESRRKAEQNEFRAREEKRKKKEDKVQTHHLLRLHLRHRPDLPGKAQNRREWR